MTRSLILPLLLAALLSSSAAQAAGELDANATLWTPYEWSFNNASFSGNPFDLIATVTFTHTGSAEVHATEMFYDGGVAWKARFTGTQVGTWTASSSSSDADLNGLSGTIVVVPGSLSFGFMDQHTTTDGTKWTRQTAEGQEAFIPQIVMYHEDPKDYEADIAHIDSTIQTFIIEHGFNGFHTASVAGRWFDIDGDQVVEAGNEDPDLRTFRAIELLIARTHANGGMVHLWVWGDQERLWTPTELPGGINGAEDRRLQRYIAARLGPVPGWSMGYGFDLQEWVNETQLRSWRDFMQSRLGWFHYLGGRYGGPHSGTNHSGGIGWNEDLDYSGWEHWEPDYSVYVAALGAVPDQPAFSEDRFRVRGFDGPGKDYTFEQSRRGLWDSAMAGGVANIWGNLTTPQGDIVPHDLSLPYPNPEWSLTYSTFLFTHGRYALDLVRANQLTDGLALHAPGSDFHILYITDSNSIQVDLSANAEPQPAVAVDTTAAYAEIDLGLLDPTNHTLVLPSVSDWAIAIGTPEPPKNSAIFGDGFETGDTSRWSNSVPGA